MPRLVRLQQEASNIPAYQAFMNTFLRINTSEAVRYRARPTDTVNEILRDSLAL